MLIQLDFISTSSYWKLISMSNLYANYYWESYDRNSCSVQHWMRIVLNELGLWLWYVHFNGILSYSSTIEKMFFKRRTRPTWGLPIWSGNWTYPFISTFYGRNSHFFITPWTRITYLKIVFLATGVTQNILNSTYMSTKYPYFVRLVKQSN